MNSYYVPQHIIQKKLLALANEMNLGVMSLRKIGALVGAKSAQVVKHHLQQL
ncbi:MAG: hypothetical protein NTY66_02725 [Candidatus Vogelbacteria bacterium]|nr:hypothetical protein [Candidatus Vogelbacteria bacterium]